jgi:hypothetical protein
LQEAEKKEAAEKKAEAKKFFDEMERNILRKIRTGEVGDDTGSPTPDPISFGQDGSYEGRPRRSSIGGGIRLVRTISTIDG